MESYTHPALCNVVLVSIGRSNGMGGDSNGKGSIALAEGFFRFCFFLSFQFGLGEASIWGGRGRERWTGRMGTLIDSLARHDSNTRFSHTTLLFQKACYIAFSIFFFPAREPPVRLIYKYPRLDELLPLSRLRKLQHTLNHRASPTFRKLSLGLSANIA